MANAFHEYCERRKARQNFTKFEDLIASPGDLAAGFKLPAAGVIFASVDALVASPSPVITAGDPTLTTARRVIEASDNATSTDMGNWTQLNPSGGSITKASGKLVGDAGAVAVWSAPAIFRNSMFAAVLPVLTGLSPTKTVGVVCRATPGIDALRDYYALYVTDDGLTTWTLSKIINGTETVLDTGTVVIAPTDTIELQVEDSHLRAYIGGVLLSTKTDTGLTYGLPGVSVDDTMTAGNWNAGTLLPKFRTLYVPVGAANAIRCYDQLDANLFIKKASGAPGTVSVYVGDGFGNPVLIAQG